MVEAFTDSGVGWIEKGVFTVFSTGYKSSWGLCYIVIVLVTWIFLGKRMSFLRWHEYWAHSHAGVIKWVLSNLCAGIYLQRCWYSPILCIQNAVPYVAWDNHWHAWLSTYLQPVLTSIVQANGVRVALNFLLCVCVCVCFLIFSFPWVELFGT